jgi:hypothetical protein
MAEKKPVIVTPRGTAVGFVSIVDPSAQYDAYGITLEFDAKDAATKQLISSLEDFKTSVMKRDVEKLKEKLGKKYESKFKEDWLKTNEDDDDIPKGKVRIKFGTKAKTKFGENKVVLIDATKQRITDKSLKVGEGTTAKVQFSPRFYITPDACGLTFDLIAVQIINLVAYSGGAKFDEDAFDEEEGFSYQDEVGEVPESVDESEKDDDDELSDGDF